MIDGTGKISGEGGPEITKRGTRRGYVAAFFVATLLFCALSLPSAILGEDGSFQDVLVRVRMLERKVLMLTGLSAYKIPPRIALCGIEIPVKRPEVREALEQEFYMSLSNRGKVILWVKRSGKYFPYIEQELKKRGLPDDLKYLAVAESDLAPDAYSPAHASGVWQFIEGTGRHFGLRIDANIDQRRDFSVSTQAALNFLTQLNKQFNDWLLAMAAYNAGPGRVAGALENQKVESYFDMCLPRETERYIFRIAAIKIIMSEPEKYGVELAAEEKYPLYEADTITVTVTTKSLDLTQVADIAGMNLKQLTDLNPQFTSDSLPRGAHSIYLPKGSSAAFVQAWNDKHKDSARTGQAPPEPVQLKKVFYTVRKGDTLASIARRYDCSVNDICRWNRINKNDVLPAGKKLIIFQ